MRRCSFPSSFSCQKNDWVPEMWGRKYCVPQLHASIKRFRLELFSFLLRTASIYSLNWPVSWWIYFTISSCADCELNSPPWVLPSSLFLSLIAPSMILLHSNLFLCPIEAINVLENPLMLSKEQSFRLRPLSFLFSCCQNQKEKQPQQ